MTEQHVKETDHPSSVPGIESMDFVRSAWHGYSDLWVAFWIYGVLFGFVMSAMGNLSIEYGMAAELLAIAIGLAWYVWSNVAIWRSSKNTSWQGWGVLACVYVFVNVTAIIVTLFMAIIESFTGAV